MKKMILLMLIFTSFSTFSNTTCDIVTDYYGLFILHKDGKKITNQKSSWGETLKDQKALIDAKVCASKVSTSTCEIVKGPKEFFEITKDGGRFITRIKELEYALKEQKALINAKVCVSKDSASTCDIVTDYYGLFILHKDGKKFTNQKSSWGETLKDQKALIDAKVCASKVSASTCDIVKGPEEFFEITKDGGRFITRIKELEYALKEQKALIDAKVCMPSAGEVPKLVITINEDLNKVKIDDKVEINQSTMLKNKEMGQSQIERSSASSQK